MRKSMICVLLFTAMQSPWAGLGRVSMFHRQIRLR